MKNVLENKAQVLKVIQLYRFLAVHCVQPRFSVLFAERLQRQGLTDLLVKRQVEAEPLLEFGNAAGARR
jgi:hypothetical protein